EGTRRTQTAMHDACIVRARERPTDLRCDPHRDLGLELPARDAFVERLARRIVRDDEGVVVFGPTDVDDADETGMLHLRRALRLADHPLAPRSGLDLQHVCANDPVLASIAGPVHPGHPVPAELALEAEPA